MKYWLVKTEPSTFSVEHLKKLPKKTTCWEGVRNYQARNFMKDMKIGDKVFFYHSVAKPTAIVAITTVVKEAYPDHTQFDVNNKYFDSKSKPEAPTWFMVDLQLEKELKTPLTLEYLKTVNGLENMFLLRKGSRLSVQPVTQEEWDIINTIL